MGYELEQEFAQEQEALARREAVEDQRQRLANQNLDAAMQVEIDAMTRAMGG